MLLLMMMMTMIGLSGAARPPHIIFIFADDLGWDDVSFHGNSQVPTPNIDDLARAGMTLHHYYSDWLCTPSRAALMTARYALRHGLQHGVIFAGERSGLPLNNTLLPQYLRDLGYSTHMVGKWHLGYHLKAHMPTERGFDSFFGYGNGVVDYYDYTNNNDGLSKDAPQDPVFYGSDLFNGTEPLRHFRGEYATRAFTERALQVIAEHDTSKPLFLYLAHLAMHGSGGGGNVVQAPPEHVARFPHISNHNRRVFAGMLSALDDSVGAVVSALGARGMLGESVVVFASDNGGQTEEAVGGYASNAPLRGKKHTLWEGAVRVPALVLSPLLPRGGVVWEGLMHVSDWLPTLYSAAGGDPKALKGPLDGLDQWASLSRGLPCPRTEILHNNDPISEQAAYRRGHLKVVKGGTSGEPPLVREDPPAPQRQGNSSVREVLVKAGLWPSGGDEEEWMERNRVSCSTPLGPGCDPSHKPCLFNVTEDPCEQNDIADRYQEEVRSMLAAISAFEAVPPQSKPLDPLANPACHGFAFVPWLEPEYHDPASCLAFK